MDPNPRLLQLVEAVRSVVKGEDSDPETVGALLWLILSSEHCLQTLRETCPSHEDLELLSRRLGDPVRAWIQFSPLACDLIYGQPSGIEAASNSHKAPNGIRE